MSDSFLASRFLSYSEMESLVGELSSEQYGRFKPIGDKGVSIRARLKNLNYEDMRALKLPDYVAEAALQARSYPSVPEEQQSLVPTALRAILECFYHSEISKNLHMIFSDQNGQEYEISAGNKKYYGYDFLSLYQRDESGVAIYDWFFSYFGGIEEEFTPKGEYDEKELHGGRMFSGEFIEKGIKRVCDGLEQAEGLFYENFIYDAVVFSTKKSGNIKELAQQILDELKEDYRFGEYWFSYEERLKNADLQVVETQRAQGGEGRFTLGWLYYGRKKAERLRVSVVYEASGYKVFVEEDDPASEGGGTGSNKKIKSFLENYSFDH